MENNRERELHFQDASRRIVQLRKFYMRLTVYCAVNATFFLLWLYDPYVAENFWIPTSFFTVVLAGLFILANAVNLFGGKYLWPLKWQKRKLKELMMKEYQPTTKYE